MPVCTVVIPCFNQADLLAECLPSLVAQTLTDWEAIVVDDGSTRGDAQEVVRAIGDSRIRYVRHDANRGLAAARNTGVRAGSASLVFPLDCDDMLAAACLMTLVGVLDSEPDVDCVFPDFECFGGATGVMPFHAGDVRELVERQWLPGPGCLYRRSLWERAGGYCEAEPLRFGHEDWDFYLSAGEAGFRGRHIPTALYRYRVGPGSLSVRLQYHNHQARAFIYQRHRALFDRYDAGTAFLSGGYYASAWASVTAGEPRRAIRLALRGWLIDHRSTEAGAVIARSLIPGPAISAVRRLRAVRKRRATSKAAR